MSSRNLEDQIKTGIIVIFLIYFIQHDDTTQECPQEPLVHKKLNITHRKMDSYLGIDQTLEKAVLEPENGQEEDTRIKFNATPLPRVEPTPEVITKTVTKVIEIPCDPQENFSDQLFKISYRNRKDANIFGKPFIINPKYMIKIRVVTRFM